MPTSKRKGPDHSDEPEHSDQPTRAADGTLGGEMPPPGKKERRQPALNPSGPQYLLFDKATGRIIGSYASLDARTGKYRELGDDAVRAKFPVDRPVGARAGAKAGRAVELGVLPVDAADATVNVARMRVDPKGRIVPKPQLQLSADRTAIAGDGKDSVDITVTAVDADEKTDAHFAGEVRVTTTHGRLSERGGRVTLRKGVAHITLTSTTETIARVVVAATDEQKVAVRGELDLEFL